MTHHPLFCTCALLSQLPPYGLCCLQTPKSLSWGQGLFLWEPLHSSSSSEERRRLTMMSYHSQSPDSASIYWQNVQQSTRLAFVGPIANSCKLTIWRQQLGVMKAALWWSQELRGRRQNTSSAFRSCTYLGWGLTRGMDEWMLTRAWNPICLWIGALPYDQRDLRRSYEDLRCFKPKWWHWIRSENTAGSKVPLQLMNYFVFVFLFCCVEFLKSAVVSVIDAVT